MKTGLLAAGNGYRANISPGEAGAGLCLAITKKNRVQGNSWGKENFEKYVKSDHY